MRFTRLNLVKFGMFTETELDLLPEGVASSSGQCNDSSIVAIFS